MNKEPRYFVIEVEEDERDGVKQIREFQTKTQALGFDCGRNKDKLIVLELDEFGMEHIG